MAHPDPPPVALRGAGAELAKRIRELSASGAAGHPDERPADAAGLARWYGTDPSLIELSRHFDMDVTLHIVGNCVADLLATGDRETAVSVLERLFVEAHSASDPGAIGRATWCGWLLSGLR